MNSENKKLGRGLDSLLSSGTKTEDKRKTFQANRTETFDMGQTMN